MRPTQRTLARLRKSGIRCQVVERWQSFFGRTRGRVDAAGLRLKPVGSPGVRQDLFGCIDVIALRKGRVVGIQCCAASGVASHKTKACSVCGEALADWLGCGAEFEIWGWAKRGKLWVPRLVGITLADLRAWTLLRL